MFASFLLLGLPQPQDAPKILKDMSLGRFSNFGPQHGRFLAPTWRILKSKLVELAPTLFIVHLGILLVQLGSLLAQLSTILLQLGPHLCTILLQLGLSSAHLATMLPQLGTIFLQMCTILPQLGPALSAGARWRLGRQALK